MVAHEDTVSPGGSGGPPLPYTLRQLECFLAVARTGSIARAALALSASDSAVADAITALERALGVVLFRRRRSRGAALTPDGLTILPIARRVISGAAALRAAAGSGLGPVAGTTRLGVIDSLACALLPRLIERARRLHPGIRIESRTGDLSTLLPAAERGELDLIATVDVGVPRDYSRLRIATTRLALVVAADHPLAARGRASLADIAHEPMVLHDSVAGRTHALELMAARGITPRIHHLASEDALCRALVGRGLGYSLLLGRGASREPGGGPRVACLEILPPPRATDVLLAWPRDPVPPRVAAVRGCVWELRAEIGAEVGALPSGEGA